MLPICYLYVIGFEIVLTKIFSQLIYISSTLNDNDNINSKGATYESISIRKNKRDCNQRSR